jgi:hypothetical protein
LRFLGEKIAAHFRPPTRVPQALVPNRAGGHKRVQKALEVRPRVAGREASNGAGSRPKSPGKRRRFWRDRRLPMGQCHSVANHPQSLWITLWALAGGLLQVVFR